MKMKVFTKFNYRLKIPIFFKFTVFYKAPIGKCLLNEIFHIEY